MKLIKNVWRTKKVDHIKDEQHRRSLDTSGAIIEHRNEVLFFPLDGDEEQQADRLPEQQRAEEHRNDRNVIVVFNVRIDRGADDPFADEDAEHHHDEQKQ